MTQNNNHYKELLWIAEYPHKQSAIAVDDEIFSSYSEKEQITFLKSLITLGLNKLHSDILLIPTINETTDNNANLTDTSPKITISQNPQHDNIIIGMSFLMNSDKDFDFLLYFGKQANPETVLFQGLYHAMNVLKTIEQNL